LADAFGNPFAANTLGDYEKALQFANQSLAIQENLRRSHPNDQALLNQLAFTEDAVGSIVGALGRSGEALDHHRKSLGLFSRLSSQNPADRTLAHRVRTAHFRIGNDLRDQGQPQEALEQHYLPYGKQELDQALDPTLSSREAHGCYVAHLLVGLAEMELHQPSNALPQFEAALRWKKMQVEREPNDARYARDWSQIHSELGAAQIALGQVEAGMTNLQEAVRLAGEVLAHDPVNGSSQSQLIGSLHAQAKGLAAIAQSPGSSPARRADLWAQVIQILSGCQEKLASPAMAQIRASEVGTAKKIAQDLDQARAALARLATGGGSEEAKQSSPGRTRLNVSQ
jgi:tetratricopeptide (TPR) repeat protein